MGACQLLGREAPPCEGASSRHRCVCVWGERGEAGVSGGVLGLPQAESGWGQGSSLRARSWGSSSLE